MLEPSPPPPPGLLQSPIREGVKLMEGIPPSIRRGHPDHSPSPPPLNPASGPSPCFLAPPLHRGRVPGALRSHMAQAPPHGPPPPSQERMHADVVFFQHIITEVFPQQGRASVGPVKEGACPGPAPHALRCPGGRYSTDSNPPDLAQWGQISLIFCCSGRPPSALRPPPPAGRRGARTPPSTTTTGTGSSGSRARSRGSTPPSAAPPRPRPLCLCV